MFVILTVSKVMSPCLYHVLFICAFSLFLSILAEVYWCLFQTLNFCCHSLLLAFFYFINSRSRHISPILILPLGLFCGSFSNPFGWVLSSLFFSFTSSPTPNYLQNFKPKEKVKEFWNKHMYPLSESPIYNILPYFSTHTAHVVFAFVTVKPAVPGILGDGG